jgi:hypothetical protein
LAKPTAVPDGQEFLFKEGWDFWWGRECFARGQELGLEEHCDGVLDVGNGFQDVGGDIDGGCQREQGQEPDSLPVLAE